MANYFGAFLAPQLLVSFFFFCCFVLFVLSPRSRSRTPALSLSLSLARAHSVALSISGKVETVTKKNTASACCCFFFLYCVFFFGVRAKNLSGVIFASSSSLPPFVFFLLLLLLLLLLSRSATDKTRFYFCVLLLLLAQNVFRIYFCFSFFIFLLLLNTKIDFKFQFWAQLLARSYCCCCWEFVNGRAQRFRCCVWRAAASASAAADAAAARTVVVVCSLTHTRAHAPTHTKILTHSHTQARTLYCFNAQLRRFSFCNFIFQYFLLFCFICAQLLGTCFFSFSKWKTFVAPLTSFHTDVNCGSGCDSDCDGNGDNDHDTFFFKLLQYFLLFVCLCFCCSNWDWGLQHAAGFQLGLAAQRAQWSFVTVIAVHFLVVPCGTLDHCACVFVCVFKFGYCFNLAFWFPPITTKTLHYTAQQQQQ